MKKNKSKLDKMTQALAIIVIFIIIASLIFSLVTAYLAL